MRLKCFFFNNIEWKYLPGIPGTPGLPSAPLSPGGPITPCGPIIPVGESPKQNYKSMLLCALLTGI